MATPTTVDRWLVTAPTPGSARLLDTPRDARAQAATRLAHDPATVPQRRPPTLRDRLKALVTRAARSVGPTHRATLVSSPPERQQASTQETRAPVATPIAPGADEARAWTQLTLARARTDTQAEQAQQAETVVATPTTVDRWLVTAPTPGSAHLLDTPRDARAQAAVLAERDDVIVARAAEELASQQAWVARQASAARQWWAARQLAAGTPPDAVRAASTGRASVNGPVAAAGPRHHQAVTTAPRQAVVRGRAHRR